MSGSRESILAAVRRSLSSARAEVGTSNEPPERQETIVPRPPLERPGLDGFRDRLQGVGGVVHVVKSEAEAAECLARLFREKGVSKVALSDAPLVRRVVDALEPGSVATLAPGAPRSELLAADAGLTGAQAAIAETGTLVLDGDEEKHRLASLVPPIHVALLESRTIVGDLDDALAGLTVKGSPPTAATFVTGPSRTADIELTLVVGVHGPRELHVICLDPA